MLSDDQFIRAFWVCLSFYLFVGLFLTCTKKHSGIKYVWRISVKHQWLSLYMQCFIPRGYSIFQVTGMTKWGQKPKPKKIPRPSNPKKCLYQKSTPKKSRAEFPNLKKFQKALNDMAWKIKTLEIECLWTFLYSSYYLKLSWIFILFWRPKSLLKSSHPKNACQIFLPKNISGLKFQTPKILLSSSTHENPEYPPWGFIYVWYYPHGILLNTIIVRLSHQARSV